MKNTFSVTRQIGIAAIAGTLIFGLSACGGSETSEPLANQKPISSQKEDVAKEDTTGLVSNGTENDGAGEYTRVTFGEDAKIFKLDESLLTPEVTSLYSTDELTEALKSAATFTLEEGLDSIILSADRTNEWVENNSLKITPKYRSQVAEAMTVKSGPGAAGALVNTFMTGGRETGEYTMMLDGGPRISDLVMENAKISLTAEGDPLFEFAGTVSRRVTLNSGEAATEKVPFRASYSVARVSPESPWLISGWRNMFLPAEIS